MSFEILPFKEFVIKFDALEPIPEDHDRDPGDFEVAMHEHFEDEMTDLFESGQDCMEGEGHFLCLFTSGEEYIVKVTPEYEGKWMDCGPRFMQVTGIERIEFLECETGNHRMMYKDYLKGRLDVARANYTLAAGLVTATLDAYIRGDYHKPVTKGTVPNA